MSYMLVRLSSSAQIVERSNNCKIQKTVCTVNNSLQLWRIIFAPHPRKGEMKRKEEKKKKVVSIQLKGKHQSILEKFYTRSNLNVVVMEVSKLWRTTSEHLSGSSLHHKYSVKTFLVTFLLWNMPDQELHNQYLVTNIYAQEIRRAQASLSQHH